MCQIPFSFDYIHKCCVNKPCMKQTMLLNLGEKSTSQAFRPCMKQIIMQVTKDEEKLVHAFMTSRLDYCNALLGGCPASSINMLQIVQNAVARVLIRSRNYDHITPILQSLNWLPIKFRISYKILLLTYKALNDLAPAYLTNLLSRYNPTRSLRLQNSGLLVVPRIAKSTKGGRHFHIWLLNSGIAFLITFGVQAHSLFKSRLKTHLFSQAFI